MKKLMIAAAIVCAAVAAQAEQVPIAVHWTATSVYGVDGNLYSGSATLYLSTEGLRSGSQSEEITGTMQNGSLNTLWDTEEIDCAEAFLFMDRVAYSAYYTMDDGNGNVFTSDTLGGELDYASVLDLGKVELSLEFSRTGKWKSVPEPTSALLMLLGMAGLALKRKRA